MKKLVLLFTLLLGTLFQTQAQTLKFKVDNVQDTTVYLIKYVGSGTYYADTAFMENGNVSFNGAKQTPGILGLFIPGKRYFDFIYNNEDVSLETAAPNFMENLKVKKSAENKVFNTYLQFIQSQKEKSQKLSSKLQTASDEEKTKINAELSGINDEVIAYQNNLIKENPDKLVSKIIKMTMEVDIPENVSSSEDRRAMYTYLLEHYFDNIDLQDDRLVNTAIIQNKLEKFLSKNFIMQNPDTIMQYISPVLNQLEPGSMMYRFFVTKVTAHFQKSKIMGMDKGFNQMILNYYCTQNANGEYNANWMTKQKVEELCEETIKKMTTVLGNIPPNISLRDTTDQNWKDFYSIDAEYTILYFWDPECGHCKKETPKLGKLYREKLKERNVEVFAIGKATGEDFEAWKSFIKKHDLTFVNVGLTNSLFEDATENPYQFIPKYTTAQSLNYQDTYNIFSTPQVFVLDKDKKIVAKKLSIAQLEDFIDKKQGKEDAEKLFDVEEEKKRMEEQQERAEEAQE